MLRPFGMLRVAIIVAAAGFIALTILTSPASAQRAAVCHNGQSFDQFLAGLKQQAVAAGVSQRAIAEASPYIVYDQGIVNRDRGQRVFGQLFTQFAGRMAADYRMQNGQIHIKRYTAAFSRAEKEYGVPPAVIAAFWALESDFGAQMGNLQTLRSLVSLAYDCRRSKMFQDETIAALKIIDRGDLSPGEMIGSWAGELGQTQFLPTHYVNYAVDYDGDGHRNLLRSPEDVIGSTANYIATGLKWRRGEPWLQEVRVSDSVPWDQADLTLQLPRSKWASFGVTYADGRPLPPRMRVPAQPVAQLSYNELKELQQMLVKAGFNVGKIDGIMGQASRSAVKAMQVKFGLPADSWPTAELLARLRGR